jgi:hypothetical protein
MSKRVRFIAIVCVAVFAFTAVTALPMLALIDARTPGDILFAAVCATDGPVVEDVPLSPSPAVELLSPRAPPDSWNQRFSL